MKSTTVDYRGTLDLSCNTNYALHTDANSDGTGDTLVSHLMTQIDGEIGEGSGKRSSSLPFGHKDVPARQERLTLGSLVSVGPKEISTCKGGSDGIPPLYPHPPNQSGHLYEMHNSKH